MTDEPIAWLYAEGEQFALLDRRRGERDLGLSGWTETPLYGPEALAAWPARIAEIRNEIVKLMRATGCGCCSDAKRYRAAENRLGELLDVPRYEDNSGVDWQALETKHG